MRFKILWIIIIFYSSGRCWQIYQGKRFLFCQKLYIKIEFILKFDKFKWKLCRAYFRIQRKRQTFKKGILPW